MNKNDAPENKIVYQGEEGSNSHMACQDAFPEMTSLACATFEDAMFAVSNKEARLAMIPIENSLAGRVADVHHLLPESGLYVVGEHFERIQFQLLALPEASLDTIKTVHSHVMALGQCRNVIRELGLIPVVEADTAGSARMVAASGDLSQAAIAPNLAAEIHHLKILKKDIEDAEHNTTRFLILAAEPDDADVEDGPIMTTFIFRVRNVPAALYKALGGFATNGVNMTKLESYQLGGTFEATMFHADVEGHPQERLVQLALEELSFFSTEVRILGSYKASPIRQKLKERMELPPMEY